MAVLEAPAQRTERIRPAVSAATSDQALVAALRAGDERAFEQLYTRYHRRIHAYVLGMCKDHARAEDVVQEVFVSALRRMRATEQPIAFKPWIYEIAKNACIDLFRRSRRVEEVSLEADDGLGAADLGRLAAGGPTPDAAVAAKQALDQLCGAFGGLSDVHHEILVMRELEGLSYREIGERLGMSRPAVESTLFRARRRLTEEYDELVSGQRCQRIQGIIVSASAGRLGARDTRRLARHVAHCQPCRREALAAGLDADVLRRPLRTRVAEKVAALLPFPALARRLGARGGADHAAAPGADGGPVSAWFTQLPALSDQLGAGWGKAIAAAAVVLAGLGAGVGTNTALGGPDHARPHRAAPAAHRAAAPAAAAPVASTPQVRVVGAQPAKATTRHAARRNRHGARTRDAARQGSGSTGAAKTGGGTRAAGGGGSSPAGPVSHTASGGSTAGSGGGSGGGGASLPSAPKVTRPAAALPAVVTPSSAPAPVQTVTKPIEAAAAPVAGAVQGAVEDTVAPVVQDAKDAVGALAPKVG